MKYLIPLSFLLALQASIGAQGSWTIPTPPMPRALASVFFTNDTTGYAVGSSGTIIKTSNGGSSWVQQTVAPTYPLGSVYFSNAKTGYAVGGSCTIVPNFGCTYHRVMWNTHDGGANWNLQLDDGGPMLTAVYFSNQSTGYALGYQGNILKTIDSGATWIPQTSGVQNMLFAIFFSNNNTGWTVGGDAMLLKTHDAGSTWTQKYVTTGRNLLSVYFVDSNTGWITDSKGGIYKTTNGGDYWAEQPSGTTAPLNSVFFTDANTGYVAGEAGILGTVNGGNSWSTQLPPSSSIFTSIFFTRSGLGYAVGNIKAKDTGIVAKYIDPTPILSLGPTDKSKYTIENGRLNYWLPNRSRITLHLFDVEGHSLMEVANRYEQGGYHTVTIPGGLQGSHYFLTFRAGEYRETLHIHP